MRAVGEVQHQADGEPARQSEPVGPAEAVDHRATHEDSENGHDGQRGNGKPAHEIRAAAQANLGDFAAAQKSQTKAVGIAKKLGWNSAPQKERLAGYQAGKPWTGDLFAFY